VGVVEQRERESVGGLRIAQIVPTFPPWHGGMGYICAHYASELVARGHQVTVFTLDVPVKEEPKEALNYDVVRLKSLLRVGDGGPLPQLMPRLRAFDVFHLHYPFFGGAEYVYLASLLTGKEYMLTYHMDVFGNTALKRALVAVYEPLFLRRILRRAVALSGPGRRYMESTKAAPHMRWERWKDVGYGGVDTDRFSPREKDEELLARYRLSGKTVALFVGNLQPFKGVSLLIDAIAAIPDDRIALLIVGGGYSEPALRQQVRQLGLGDRVVFAGPKSPSEDLPQHYNLADFFVLPSTHSESFGLVSLEAMASGLPVIVSDLPGPSQLVEDGSNGFVCRIGDVNDLREKVLAMAKDGPARRRMGIRARTLATGKYSWGRIGERLNDVLIRLVTRR